MEEITIKVVDKHYRIEDGYNEFTCTVLQKDIRQYVKFLEDLYKKCQVAHVYGDVDTGRGAIARYFGDKYKFNDYYGNFIIPSRIKTIIEKIKKKCKISTNTIKKITMESLQVLYDTKDKEEIKECLKGESLNTLIDYYNKRKEKKNETSRRS